MRVKVSRNWNLFLCITEKFAASVSEVLLAKKIPSFEGNNLLGDKVSISLHGQRNAWIFKDWIWLFIGFGKKEVD
jgi:hypothetical protein